MKKNDLPLVYSCSGCSQVAQLANRIAVTLDRRQHVQMSCIAGVGGQVKPLLKLARSGRPILAIDGCALSCAKHSLANIGVQPSHHLQLADYGLKKKCAEEYSDEVAEQLVQEINQTILPQLIPLTAIVDSD